MGKVSKIVIYFLLLKLNVMEIAVSERRVVGGVKKNLLTMFGF